jgi:hypothetical protein
MQLLYRYGEDVASLVLAERTSRLSRAYNVKPPSVSSPRRTRRHGGGLYKSNPLDPRPSAAHGGAPIWHRCPWLLKAPGFQPL